MSVEDEPVIGETGRWTRAAVILLRLALLVFLVWALVSARLARETPVAGDPSPPAQEGRSMVEPCSAGAEHPV